MKWAISQGSSQSGNFIRSYIHLGFNQDEEGRIVWDENESINIAGRQLAMNFRFAMPSGAAGANEPGSEGVVWWGKYVDEVRHLPTASLLDRCTESGTCPKIIESFGGSEFWQLRMSVGLVGNRCEGRYSAARGTCGGIFLPAWRDGGGRGGFNTAMTSCAPAARCPENPNPEPSLHVGRSARI